MATLNPWNEHNAEVSDDAPPLLSHALALDCQDIVDRPLGTGDDGAVVLAEMTWDISDDEGVASPWGGESGSVYLAACGSRYWIILCADGDREVEPVDEASDVDAVRKFLKDYVDGNDDVATIYLRPQLHNP